MCRHCVSFHNHGYVQGFDWKALGIAAGAVGVISYAGLSVYDYVKNFHSRRSLEDIDRQRQTTIKNVGKEVGYALYHFTWPVGKVVVNVPWFLRSAFGFLSFELNEKRQRCGEHCVCEHVQIGYQNHSVPQCWNFAGQVAPVVSTPPSGPSCGFMPTEAFEEYEERGVYGFRKPPTLHQQVQQIPRPIRSVSAAVNATAVSAAVSAPSDAKYVSQPGSPELVVKKEK